VPILKPLYTQLGQGLACAPAAHAPPHQVVWLAIGPDALDRLRPDPQPLGAWSVAVREPEACGLAKQLVENEGLAGARAAGDGDHADGCADGAQQPRRGLADLAGSKAAGADFAWARRPCARAWYAWLRRMMWLALRAAGAADQGMAPPAL
jgi:hypothetical protein